MNEGQKVYEKIKNEIAPSDFKDEKNKKIAKVLYEELEKGDISNIIGLFSDDEELISHITYILSKELDISDVDKAVNDLMNKFLIDKLLEEKNLILKKLVSENLDKEQIIDKYNGFLIPMDDINMFKEKLELLMTDKKLLKELSDNSKQFSKRFESDIIIKEWIKLFEEINR